MRHSHEFTTRTYKTVDCPTRGRVQVTALQCACGAKKVTK